MLSLKKPHLPTIKTTKKRLLNAFTVSKKPYGHGRIHIIRRFCIFLFSNGYPILLYA